MKSRIWWMGSLGGLTAIALTAWGQSRVDDSATDAHQAVPQAPAMAVQVSELGNTAAAILDANASRISFQALLTDAVGDPLIGTSVDLAFALYGVGGGVPIETISQQSYGMNNGLVQTFLSFSPANFPGAARELGVTISGQAEMAPRIPLSAVPYAFRVNRVASAELDDDIALGNASTAGRLNVFHGASAIPSVVVEGSASQLILNKLSVAPMRPGVILDGNLQRISAIGNDGSDSAVLFARSFGAQSRGELWLYDAGAPPLRTVLLSGSVNSGGLLELSDTNGALRTSVSAPIEGGLIQVMNGSAVPTAELEGKLGTIRATSSMGLVKQLTTDERLVQMRSQSWGGEFETWDENGLRTLLLGSSNASGGVITVQTGIGGTGVLIDGDGGLSDGRIAIQKIVQNIVRLAIDLDGDDGDGSPRFSMFDAGSERVRIDANGSGGGAGVNLYNSNGLETIQLDADESDSGFVALFNAAGHGTLGLDADDGNGGRLTLGDSAGAPAIIIDGNDNNGSRMTLNDSAGNDTIVLDANNGNGARVALSDDGSSTVVLNANDGDGGGRAALFNATGGETVRLDGCGGDDLGTCGGGILLYNGFGNTATIEIDANETGQGALMRIGAMSGGSGHLFVYSNNESSATINLNGHTGNTSTKSLTITGGADLAEPFDVATTGTAVSPGTVVCLDPEAPSKLRVCDQAYDRLVAGIVSGARGINPGLVMGQDGTAADGAHPVALTGRVYVMADGPVRVGDLLTTALTPGHAQSVSDFPRAQGAIIGKAMTPLSEGPGLVLVLVGLQ